MNPSKKKGVCKLGSLGNYVMHITKMQSTKNGGSPNSLLRNMDGHFSSYLTHEVFLTNPSNQKGELL